MSASGAPARRLDAQWLGRRPYRPVHDLQCALHAARSRGCINDTVLFLEHEPVITRGRGTKDGHLLASPGQLASRGVDLVDTGRGGDVTLHAPGQLVCYPIIDLSPDRRDVRRYVGDLASVMGEVARHVGVACGLVDGLVGLWVDRVNPSEWRGSTQAQELAKLGAIGVKISRWVTMHGFALNVTTDMSLFQLIVPCGIHEHGVASIETLTGHRHALDGLAQVAHRALCDLFDAERRQLADCSHCSLDELWP